MNLKGLLIISAILFSAAFCFSQSKSIEPIRGTWITNVASDALKSKQHIKNTIRLCKEYGLNHIFVVVWNNGKTIYPSDVVNKYVGIKQSPVYKDFDPIKQIVKEAHKAGIKVHAWFEFGFSYSYKDTTSVWLKKYPHWAGKNSKGELLQKNGFYWWSSFNTEVQKFLEELVLEVVTKYKVDGIQGDDRMPAMPAEGGYDDYAKKLFVKEHNGEEPPKNPNESKFLQWKADKVSAFGKDLYSAVKKVKPGCMVSWAPSIYPWSKEEYLQDWPAWLNGGYADFIMPQLYRYDIVAYEKILKELSSQLNADQKKVVFPGILTGLGDGYRIKDDMLQKIILLNRQYGFEGECQFYYESLKSNKKMY